MVIDTHFSSIYGMIPGCSQGSLSRRNDSTTRALAQSTLVGLEHKVEKRIKIQEGKLMQKPGFYDQAKMIGAERKTQLKMCTSHIRISLQQCISF